MPYMLLLLLSLGISLGLGLYCWRFRAETGWIKSALRWGLRSKFIVQVLQAGGLRFVCGYRRRRAEIASARRALSVVAVLENVEEGCLS